MPLMSVGSKKLAADHTGPCRINPYFSFFPIDVEILKKIWYHCNGLPIWKEGI